MLIPSRLTTDRMLMAAGRFGVMTVDINNDARKQRETKMRLALAKVLPCANEIVLFLHFLMAGLISPSASSSCQC